MSVPKKKKSNSLTKKRYSLGRMDLSTQLTDNKVAKILRYLNIYTSVIAARKRKKHD